MSGTRSPSQAERSDDCPVCLEHELAEGEAESAGDLSRATDWRVLRRRHETAAHEEGRHGAR